MKLVPKSMTTLIDFYCTGNRGQALSALLRVYPSYSIKRTLLKGVNALNQIGPRVLPSEILVSKIDNILPSLDEKANRTYLLHKAEKIGRVYTLEQSDDGGATIFTKIALNDKAAHGIRKEFAALNSLFGYTPFKIPNVLSFKNWEGGCALSVSATQHGEIVYDKRHRLPGELFDAVASLRPATLPDTLPAKEVEGWLTALEHASSPEICKVARSIKLESLFSVGAAHRDLGSENILHKCPAKALSDYTLIDWEFFTETAPALTDRVGVWLGARHRHLKGWRNRNPLADQFLSDFSDAPGGQHAAVLALLHLAELGIDLARILTGDTRGAK